jgi:hypothetical protein
VTSRYRERKKATCKAALSSGARVEEGHIVDLTVPGCLNETAVVLEVGKPFSCVCTWTNTRPCALILGLSDGYRMARRASSSFAWSERINCGSGFMWAMSRNVPRLAAVGPSSRSVWGIRNRSILLPIRTIP